MLILELLTKKLNLTEQIKTKTNYSSEFMWPIYNFKAQLEPHINKGNKQLIRITKCQQFKINYEGKFW